MQDTSQITNWDAIKAGGDYDVETRVTINGTAYTGFDGQSGLWEIKKSGAIMPRCGVGNCMFATLELSLVNPGVIARNATIVVEIRLKNDLLTSGWMEKGTFFIAYRDKSDDFLHITAYDAILKTEQSFTQPGAQGVWPRTDISVVTEICTRIGVSLDSQTEAILVNGYDVQYPGITLDDGTPQYTTDGALSMREVLGYIGAMYAGNWCISDTGELRLIQLNGSTDTATVGNDYDTFDLGPEAGAISKVVIVLGTDSSGVEQTVEAGTDTGAVLEINCPWGTQAMADNILAQVEGYNYIPFTATGTILDPAAELGDEVDVDEITSVIASISTSFDPLFTTDIEAPWDSETDNEYGYVSSEDRQLQRAISKNRVSFNVGLDAISSTVSDLASQTESQILQLADSITLSVSTSTGAGGQTYASITLRVGEEMFTGQILLDGNVNVSGQLSADALYTTYGDMAALTVDRLRTSRRIPLYLAQNTNDDNFIDIVGERMILYAGVYDATLEGEYLDENGDAVATVGYTQATNPNHEPIFWESDPEASGVVLGTDGYPYLNGVRIFTTTQNTGYPVFVYTYTEQAKGRIAFEQNYQTGYYEPKITLGVGDTSGHNIAHINKTSEALEVLMDATNGKNVGMVAGANGTLDLYGLRKTTRLDFSAFDFGSFTETLDGNVINYYSVAFGEINGVRVPVKITDAEGHETEIVW